MTQRDIQNFAPGVYAQAAPLLLADQHAFLLHTLEGFLAHRVAPTLLVLGSGAEVLPYSHDYVNGRLEGTRRERIKHMLGDGRLVLIDVTDDAVSGLTRGAETLARCGFFEPGYFRKVLPGSPARPFVPSTPVDADDYPPGSIILICQNLRDPLVLAAGSVDAVDANLSLHHVTQTRNLLVATYAAIFEVMKPGGLLHLGEGRVDMGSTEGKMLRLARDLAEICGSTVELADLRDPSHPSRSDIGPADSPDLGYALQVTLDGLALVRPGRPGCPITVSPASSHIGEALKSRGYRQMLILPDSIVLPLVDPLMARDACHVEEVFRYYDALADRATRGYGNKDEHLVRLVTEAIHLERGNAARGVVEFYQSEEANTEALALAGFTDIISTHHEDSPLYSMVARKPFAADR